MPLYKLFESRNNSLRGAWKLSTFYQNNYFNFSFTQFIHKDNVLIFMYLTTFYNFIEIILNLEKYMKTIYMYSYCRCSERDFFK